MQVSFSAARIKGGGWGFAGDDLRISVNVEAGIGRDHAKELGWEDSLYHKDGTTRQVELVKPIISFQKEAMFATFHRHSEVEPQAFRGKCSEFEVANEEGALTLTFKFTTNDLGILNLVHDAKKDPLHLVSIEEAQGELELGTPAAEPEAEDEPKDEPEQVPLIPEAAPLRRPAGKPQPKKKTPTGKKPVPKKPKRR